MSEVRRSFGRLDVLFVNAGIGQFLPIAEATEEHFDRIFDTNVKGAYFTVQKALPLLTRGASIILNSSIAGLIGMPNNSVYAASKAALRSLARTLSADLVDRGIRVNVISPGPVTTPIFGRLGLTPEALDEFAARVRQNVPLKRFGDPHEIAHAAVFLASDESTFFIGAELVADGGLSQLRPRIGAATTGTRRNTNRCGSPRRETPLRRSPCFWPRSRGTLRMGARAPGWRGRRHPACRPCPARSNADRSARRDRAAGWTPRLGFRDLGCR